MAAFTIENLTFKYPGREKAAFENVSFTVEEGEFIVLCGKSGCGKTSLLRQLKTVLTPAGMRSGKIEFYGKRLEEVSTEEQAKRIGYVLQNPDAQIVTDKVWHELAFGLESLGLDNQTIRIRVSEIANYFGIQKWFNDDVAVLSGGQKQLLNLASVVAMQPDVLILDEPTSQLDPTSAGEFLETVKKINRDLGTTVIITEHRLDEVLPMADRAIAMDEGKILAADIPANVAAILAVKGHEMFPAMPSPLQAYGKLYDEGIGRDLPAPCDVSEGRKWLSSLLADKEIKYDTLPDSEEKARHEEKPSIELKDVWFKYEKEGKDVVKDLSLKVYAGEIFAMVGGNGSGKSTAVSIIAGLKKAYRGKVRVEGRACLLPQNPQMLFANNTVEKELRDLTSDEILMQEIAEVTDITGLFTYHPYDLSGGEQQRVALAKVLLTDPDIILLDEPTKGLDNYFKETFAKILKKLASQGKTIVLVSHDVEFCGKHADRCAMFFDGSITTIGTPRKVFSGNSFYTTAANRMSRKVFANAITANDVVELVLANMRGHSDIAVKSKKSIETERKGESVKSGADPNETIQTNSRKFGTREIVTISALITIIVLGRLALFMLPNCKPMLALTMIFSLCLGPQTGFLLGSMSAFVSNIFFGQGPWTIWQMLALGTSGFIAGVMGRSKFWKEHKYAFAVSGALIAIIVYGSIVDIWTLLGFYQEATLLSLLKIYLVALPMNLVHAGATSLYLIVFAVPLIEKLSRLKTKYGLRFRNMKESLS